MKTLRLDPVASIALALSHPTRLRILLILRDGPLCVCQLTSALGGATSTISAHLADLRRAGLVGESRRGKFVSYALAQAGTALPWLRLALKQGVDDPVAADDRAKGLRIRQVSAEEFLALGADIRRLPAYPAPLPSKPSPAQAPR